MPSLIPVRRLGYVRTPVTFSCSAKRKVTKEKAAPVSRAMRVPCAACLTSAAVELAQSEPQAPRTELRQSSPTPPRPSELLGATQGPQLRNAVAALGAEKVTGVRTQPGQRIALIRVESLLAGRNYSAIVSKMSPACSRWTWN